MHAYVSLIEKIKQLWFHIFLNQENVFDVLQNNVTCVFVNKIYHLLEYNA